MEFHNYYKKLMEHYDKNTPDYGDGVFPEYFLRHGWHGDVMWWEVLEEGLISTYPKKHVEKFLKKVGALRVEYYNIVPYQHEKTNTIVTQFPLPIKDLNDFVKNLNEGLHLYGWRIGGVIRDIPSNGIVTIEPIFPAEYNPTQTDNFYHITHKDRLDKIKKIGLIPRETQTIFQHPGNRIYLIQVSNLNTLELVAQKLSDGRWDTKDSIYINIDVDGLKLYEDPLFPSAKGTFKACFTPDNIHPNRIVKTLP